MIVTEQGRGGPEPSSTAGLDGPPASPECSPSRPGMGLGMRMAADLVVTTLVGVGMGYYLDKWLETQPWMTVLFFLLGAVAGFRTVYRTANGNPS